MVGRLLIFALSGLPFLKVLASRLVTKTSAGTLPSVSSIDFEPVMEIMFTAPRVKLSTVRRRGIAEGGCVAGL